MSADDIATVREALHILYSYTSDDANPPGEGRSGTRSEGYAALARLEAELHELRQVAIEAKSGRYTESAPTRVTLRLPGEAP